MKNKMFVDYEDLYIKLASKYVFCKITDKEKKMLHKLGEWKDNDDVNSDYELEDIDE